MENKPRLKKQREIGTGNKCIVECVAVQQLKFTIFRFTRANRLISLDENNYQMNAQKLPRCFKHLILFELVKKTQFFQPLYISMQNVQL